MMDAFIVALDSMGRERARDSTIESIIAQRSRSLGGKAAVLSLLLEEGFPVPPGICLTPAVFERMLAPLQKDIQRLLEPYDLREPDLAAHVSGQITALLSQISLPAAALNTLSKLLPQIGEDDTRFAVRSSAVHEDGRVVSFAGQYATILGAQGLDEVHSAVKACYLAYFSPHALAARARGGNGAAEADTRNGGAWDLAILIQPLVDAGCAGVCFSIDPVAQDGQHIVVNSAWGLGAGVADGRVPNDTDWLRREGFQVQRRHIVPKEWQMKLDAAGQMQIMPVADQWQRAACLPQSWLERLGQMAVALENLLGTPQDVEWAAAGNKLWILQSRPITALPESLRHVPPFAVDWQNDEKQKAWTPAYFRSGINDPPLPLEFAQYALMEEERQRACFFMGLERDVVYKKINGRPYDRPQPLNWSEADRRVRNQALEEFRDRVFDEGRTMWDVWGPEVEAAMARLRAFDRDQATVKEMVGHLKECLAVMRRDTFVHPQCVWRPRQAYFKAYSALSGASGPAAERAAAQLLQGEETVLTRLIDALYELAQTAGDDPRLAALVSDPPDDVLKVLDALPDVGAIPTFKRQLAAILDVYGERTGDGYGSRVTVCSPTWREDPAELLQKAAIYLDPGMEAPADSRARAQAVREEQVEALCAACEDPEAVAEFQRLLATGRRWWTVLETHNHFIDQMDTGHLRHAASAAARLLVENGLLADEGDVFWLTFDEIIEALQQDGDRDWTSKINERRQQHAFWQQMTPPPFLGLPAADLPQREAPADEVTEKEVEPGRIRGIGAAPGQVTGRARVMKDAWRLPDLEPGDILVAPNVGPKWTPILPMLAAIVLDEGSVGQHAAATAREYGVTAVVETGDGSRRIVDGSQIFVDGVEGVVEVLQPRL